MLHRSGALEATSAALEPLRCIRAGRWKRPVRHWNRNAAKEWDTGAQHCGYETAMLHTNGGPERRLVWNDVDIQRNGAGEVGVMVG